jgi:hypothetical protein
LPLVHSAVSAVKAASVKRVFRTNHSESRTTYNTEGGKIIKNGGTAKIISQPY